MSACIDDGGPVFPAPDCSQNNTTGETTTHQSYPGASMRDVFASEAMQGHLTAAWLNPSPSSVRYKEWAADQPADAEHTSFQDWIACTAFDQADAMIRARGRQP